MQLFIIIHFLCILCKKCVCDIVRTPGLFCHGLIRVTNLSMREDDADDGGDDEDDNVISVDVIASVKC